MSCTLKPVVAYELMPLPKLQMQLVPRRDMLNHAEYVLEIGGAAARVYDTPVLAVLPTVFRVRLSEEAPTLYVDVDRARLPVIIGPNTPFMTSFAFKSKGSHVISDMALFSAKETDCEVGVLFFTQAVTVTGCALLVPQATSVIVATSIVCWKRE
jgi:hypothetical protein